MRDRNIYRRINHTRRRKNYLGLIITLVIVCAALVIITVIGVSYGLSRIGADPSRLDAESAETTANTAPVGEDSETTAPDALYAALEYDNSAVHEGTLILVNAGHEYVFPEKPRLKTIYGNKTLSYKVRDTLVELDRTTLTQLNDMMDAFYEASGRHDVLVVSGYRDYETQLELYSARVEEMGIENPAETYVALPGCSEHHTAMSFDFSVYTDDGISMTIDDDEAYHWIYDHCHQYGFVRRYDAAKTDITGIVGEKWHFRYVGKPHAYYMKKHDLCLEEYIEELRQYPFDSAHLTFADDEGHSWELYYVPAVEGETTSITVPESAEYTISGNNADGFVVTIQVN